MLTAFMPVAFPLFVAARLLLPSSVPSPTPGIPVDSECQTLPGGHDTTTLLVNALLEAKDPAVSLPEVYADSLERIIAEQFHPPAITAFAVASPIYINHANPSIPTLDTHLYFYLRKDGSITDPMGIGMSLNPTWEEALLDAFDPVIAQRLFPPPPNTVQQDSVLIAYTVSSVPVHTGPPVLARVIAAPKTAALSHPPLSHGHSMQLASLTVPIFPPHTTPAPRPGSPKPSYPEEARRAGAEDYVVAGFVIGPNGVPITSTIDITAAHYQEFIASVRETIPKLRFTPSTMMGCAVNAYVQVPFVFNLRR